MPALPPWLQAADPATHMAQGMHIGIQIGAQQAEERFRQQQLAARAAQQQQEEEQQAAAQRFKEVQSARTEQIAARDQALAESKFQLAASEAARKHQAFQEYQGAVTGGMDPNEAMLKWGPAMSANTGAAAAIRAHERESRVPLTPTEVTLPSGMRGVQMGQRFQFEPSAKTGAVARVPEGAKFVEASEDAPAHWQLPVKPQPEISASERSATLRAIRDERKQLVEGQNADLLIKRKQKGTKLKPEEEQVLAQLQALDDQEKSLLPRLRSAQGTTTQAVQQGGVLKVVRDADGNFVMAGQSAASPRVQVPPMMQVPPGLTAITPQGQRISGQGTMPSGPVAISPEGLVMPNPTQIEPSGDVF